MVLMWMSSKLLLNFNGLLNLLTALVQLWNVDDGYIAMGRDTYIYHRYRQRNKCHGWTSGYGHLSSNEKPYLTLRTGLWSFWSQVYFQLGTSNPFERVMLEIVNHYNNGNLNNHETMMNCVHLSFRFS